MIENSVIPLTDIPSTLTNIQQQLNSLIDNSNSRQLHLRTLIEDLKIALHQQLTDHNLISAINTQIIIVREALKKPNVVEMTQGNIII